MQHVLDAWVQDGEPLETDKTVCSCRPTYFQQPSLSSREASALGRATPDCVHRTSFPRIELRHMRLCEA